VALTQYLYGEQKHPQVIMSHIRTRDRNALSLRTSNSYSWKYLTHIFDVSQ